MDLYRIYIWSEFPVFKARNMNVKHRLQLKLHDDIHIHNLNQKRHHVSIAHTNMQSLMPNVTEFEAMVSRNQSDLKKMVTKI